MAPTATDSNVSSVGPDTITRDVCVIGGGGAGTYTALRIKDSGKSVVVVDPSWKLGGHAETYHDPKTGKTLDVGVIVFGHLDEVKNLFARFNIPLRQAPPNLPSAEYVDYATGEKIEFEPPGPERVAAAFQRYAAQITKYPELSAGFDMKYPIPDDLLMPFGKFVKKYDLGDLISLVFIVCQGWVPLLEISTLYVFKYFNVDLLNSLAKGFLMTENHDVASLYDKIADHLGQDVLLKTSVVSMDRSATSKIYVQTPSGKKLIEAKKVVFAMPLVFDKLGAFDLSSNEAELFKQFYYSAYYCGVVRNANLPLKGPFYPVAKDKPYSMPELPGIYSITPNPDTGLFQVYYGSPHVLPEDQVRREIFDAIAKLQQVRGIKTEIKPEFVAFAAHVPFNMMVSNEAIQDRFYEKLGALQGERNTFYNGASVHTQDSSVLWRYTEALLPSILKDL